MAGALMIGGFALAVTGIALWSVPAACVIAGIVLFVCGGLEYRRQA